MAHEIVQQKIAAVSSDKKNFIVSLCKILALSGVIIYFLSIFFLNDLQSCTSSSLSLFSPKKIIKHDSSSTSNQNLSTTNNNTSTNIRHLLFGLVGSAKAWTHRKAYIEAWWRPNVTRGYLYLDTTPSPPEDFFPWSKQSPPLRISVDNSKLVNETHHVAPIMVRMVHAILELFDEEQRGGGGGGGDIRWIVMGDDDSVFFVDNWVDVLGKYDHTKYVYIGGQSETLLSDFYYSFDQGFGGAGFALSYPLAEALVQNLEYCLRRYPYLNSADLITMTCIADVGVSHTAHKGIHQIDLTRDISGFLSSHPQVPLLSLHHLDIVQPMFPSKNRFESTRHLMKSAKLDESRLLQQTICYQRQTNWSFSISWGYSTHIYEKIIPRSILKKPLETFRPWIRSENPPYYIFNTRPVKKDPCEAPHVFFLDNANGKNGKIVTTYVRAAPRKLSSCENYSADYISRIKVISPATKLIETGRSECCDIVNHVQPTNMAEVRIRQCMKNEIIA